MSTEITTAFVNQYKANVQLLSQQMGSKLRRAVRVESQVGEYGFYEQIGAVTAQLKTGRHADTPQFDTPHRRRRVGMNDYSWADYIDREDQVRMLIRPESPYARNAAYAFGRQMDTDVLVAALATADTGKDGSTGVALPAGQKIAANSEGLTISKLIQARRKFWDNDVDEEIPLYIAVTGKQMEDLLNTTEVTSADYNSVKALVRGEISIFMGFEFIRTNLVNLNTSTRECVAWAKDGLLLAVGLDINTRIGERADKQYLTQVFCQMTIGATRMEEEKVVQVDCLES